jgi:hypothetical protein
LIRLADSDQSTTVGAIEVALAGSPGAAPICNGAIENPSASKSDKADFM